MFNLNLFKRPIEISTLESWSKFCDDVGKVAFVVVPAMLYSNYELWIKISSIIGLFIATYFCLVIGRNIRQFIEREKSKWD